MINDNGAIYMQLKSVLNPSIEIVCIMQEENCVNRIFGREEPKQEKKKLDYSSL